MRFQQPTSEAPLDDMVVFAEGPQARHRLDIQLKRSFAFRQSDADFDSVIEACWDTFQLPEFGDPGDRFGVARERHYVALDPQMIWFAANEVAYWEAKPEAAKPHLARRDDRKARLKRYHEENGDD